MGKGNQKSRQKLDPKKFDDEAKKKPKREKDWGFEDIARTKKRGY